MEGSDASAYEAFAAELSGSKIFGTTQDPKALIGSEVSNVLSALAKVGEDFGARVLEAIATEAIIPIPDNVGGTFNARDNGLPGSRRIYYYTYEIDKVIDGCTGASESCRVNVRMSIELESGAGGPKGDPVALSINIPAAKLKVTNLVASNAYVSIELQSSDSAVTMSSLLGEVAMNEQDQIVGAYVEVADFVSDIKATIRDVQSDATLVGGLNGGFVSLILNLDMQAKDTTAEVFEFADLNLNASVDLASASGDKLTAVVGAGGGMSGGPFTYVFGTELEKIGETATDYLQLNATATYSSVVGGAALFTGNLVGGRASNETLALENFSVQHGGQTYAITGEFSEKGEILALDTVDPVSGVRVVVTTTNGVTTGAVTSDGTQLGTIAKDDDGKLLITYTDGSEQHL